MTCTNCDPSTLTPESIIKTNKSMTKCAICGRHLTATLGQLKPLPKVLILGIDGYIGWALALHLLKEGYIVSGIDNYSRRRRVEEISSDSLTTIACTLDRRYILQSFTNYHEMPIDLSLHHSYHPVKAMLDHYKPDAIVHLAEQPSAPWSMISPKFCTETQYENVIGTLNLLWAMKETCPNAHLIKLGTMGEYGTPDCEIPEGFIPKQPCTLTRSTFDKCPMAGLPFPKSPFSFYHLSKVHDTHNIHFACSNWDLRSTDIMQGVVYGLNKCLDISEITRFDYDQYFGTVINRFCAQTISHNPMTLYGSGSQVRSFLPLKDSIQCLNIVIDNPPKKGEYRVFNQFENIYSLKSLANMVYQAASNLNLDPSIENIPNPRTEADSHYYNPVSERLRSLGYKPTTDINKEIFDLLNYLKHFADRVNPKVLYPTTTWK